MEWNKELNCAPRTHTGPATTNAEENGRLRWVPTYDCMQLPSWCRDSCQRRLRLVCVCVCVCVYVCFKCHSYDCDIKWVQQRWGLPVAVGWGNYFVVINWRFTASKYEQKIPTLFHAWHYNINHLYQGCRSRWSRIPFASIAVELPDHHGFHNVRR